MILEYKNRNQIEKTQKEDLLREIAEKVKVITEDLNNIKYPYSMDKSVRLLLKMKDILLFRIKKLKY